MSERIERYRQATRELDFETLGKCRHPEYTCTYPQSGERFVGHENWVKAHVDYASRFGSTERRDETVKGGEKHATVTTTPTVLPFVSSPVVQVSDTGDLVVLEGVGTWPDGKVYHAVMILEFRDQLVWRETQYFAEPFEAPEWRAEFTESDPA